MNNYGFEVERKVSSEQLSIGNWAKIGFLEGHGNSNSPKDYSFIDDEITSGKYTYRLKQIDNDGKYEYSQVVEVLLAPNDFTLYQNYPNPFNPTTKIKYSLPHESIVTIKIFDVLGSEVKTLVSEKQEEGTYEIDFNASSLASGMYIYRMQAGSFVQLRKMVLIK